MNKKILKAGKIIGIVGLFFLLYSVIATRVPIFFFWESGYVGWLLFWISGLFISLGINNNINNFKMKYIKGSIPLLATSSLMNFVKIQKSSTNYTASATQGNYTINLSKYDSSLKGKDKILS